MGTKNFSYDNRCVVLDDDDFINLERDFEFYDLKDYSRYSNYYSRGLIVDCELEYINIVVTNGYYSGSCLDWVLSDNIDYHDDCHYTPTGRIRTEENINKVYNKKLAREARKANKIIDKIKKDYNLQEAMLLGSISNSEGVYRNI